MADRDDEDDELEPIEDDSSDKDEPKDDSDESDTDEPPSDLEPKEDEADEDDASKEIDDAEAIAKDEASKGDEDEELDLPSEIRKLSGQGAAPEVSIDNQKVQSPADKYKDFLDQYQKLQSQRRNTDLVNGLLAAGGKIGQSMAGKYSGNFVPDPGQQQLLQAMANRPVTDFEQNQVVQSRGMQLQAEMAASDPASPQSKLVRDYLNKRLNMNLPDTVSASDAAMLMKTMGKPVISKYQKGVGTATINGVKQRVQASYDPQSGKWIGADGTILPDFVQEGLSPFQYSKDSHGNIVVLNKSNAGSKAPQVISSSAYKPVAQMSPQEVQNFQPDKDQRKALDEEQKRTDTMTKAARDGITAANELEKTLKGNNVYQGAQLKTALPRLMGFNGRMSPLEQQMWTGSQAWKDRAQQYLQTASEGTLSDTNKQQALALLQDYKNNVSKDLQNIGNGSQQRLEQSYAIPRQFSAKTLQLPQLGGSGQDPKIQKYADKYFNGNYDAASIHLKQTGQIP